MNIDFDIGNQRKLRNLFSWLTRSGMGPKFGSRPIGWYQQHQMTALKMLDEIAHTTGSSIFHVSNGILQVGGGKHVGRGRLNIATTSDFYREVDRRVRG